MAGHKSHYVRFLDVAGFLFLPTPSLAAIAMSANRVSRPWCGPVHPRGPTPSLGTFRPTGTGYVAPTQYPLLFTSLPSLHFSVSAACSTYIRIYSTHANFKQYMGNYSGCVLLSMSKPGCDYLSLGLLSSMSFGS